MTRSALILCFGVFSALRAGAQCPVGFVSAGEVAALAPAGRYKEVKTTKELELPQGIQLDDSYHQNSIQAASDGAASDMRAAQIPAGILLVPSGIGAGGWWSLDNPQLIQSSGRWIFRIDLYANTGGRTPVALPTGASGSAGRRGPATPAEAATPNANAPGTGRGGLPAESPAANVRVRVCLKVRS